MKTNLVMALLNKFHKKWQIDFNTLATFSLYAKSPVEKITMNQDEQYLLKLIEFKDYQKLG
jgi:hypothetical protein